MIESLRRWWMFRPWRETDSLFSIDGTDGTHIEIGPGFYVEGSLTLRVEHPDSSLDASVE